MSSQQPHSFFQSVEKALTKAKFTEFDPGILEQIKACNSVYQMRFPVKKMTGPLKLSKLTGYSTASTKLRAKAVSVSAMR